MPFLASTLRWLAILHFPIAATIAVAERDETLSKAAENQVDRALETVKILSAIESGSDDAEGLSRVSEVLEERLLALEFSVRRVNSEFDVRADSPVTVKTGSGSQRVILMAHMDTVFEPGTLATMSVRLENNRLYGPGIADAIGGIAVLLHGLEVLRDLGWNDYASITVLFNPDEDTGSAGSGGLISSLAADMDTVLSFDIGGSNACGFAGVIAGTAAYAQITMEVTGLASHAGTDPEKGGDAVIELAHQLLITRDVANNVDGAQLNWTNVISDKAYNQIPDSAKAIGEARLTSGGAEADLLEALNAKVAGSSLVPDTKTSISMEILRPGLTKTVQPSRWRNWYRRGTGNSRSERYIMLR